VSKRIHVILIGLITIGFFGLSPHSVAAQISTSSGAASPSSAVATFSAQIEPKPLPKTDKDITEPTTQTPDTLVSFLNTHPLRNFHWYSPLQ